MSGCFLVPDKVSSKLTSFLEPPPGFVPYNRVDVFNNVEGTIMTLHCRGGDISGEFRTGECGWVQQNVYFGSDGRDHTGDNTITARFYDEKIGVCEAGYLGLMHYDISANSEGYQAIHTPYDRKYLRR